MVTRTRSSRSSDQTDHLARTGETEAGLTSVHAVPNPWKSDPEVSTNVPEIKEEDDILSDFNEKQWVLLL